MLLRSVQRFKGAELDLLYFLQMGAAVQRFVEVHQRIADRRVRGDNLGLAQQTVVGSCHHLRGQQRHGRVGAALQVFRGLGKGGQHFFGNLGGVAFRGSPAAYQRFGFFRQRGSSQGQGQQTDHQDAKQFLH